METRAGASLNVQALEGFAFDSLEDIIVPPLRPKASHRSGQERFAARMEGLFKFSGPQLSN